MTFVVTLEGYTPPVRVDQVWTQALIDESAASTGPWTQIEVINLASLPGGADTDPENPQTRNLTTVNATLAQGWYRVTFRDNVGNTTVPSAPLHNIDLSLVNWRPTVSEVASRIRNRTIDENGNELGTFTNNTEPTASQVEDLIDESVDEMISIFTETVIDAPTGPDPDAYRKVVRAAAAALTAANVELTYFGKEVARDNSPYKQLLEDYKRRLAYAASMLGIQLPGDGTGTGSDKPNIHVWVPLGSHYSQWSNEVDDPFNDMMTRPF